LDSALLYYFILSTADDFTRQGESADAQRVNLEHKNIYLNTQYRKDLFSRGQRQQNRILITYVIMEIRKFS
jgi:hypothetical protein